MEQAEIERAILREEILLRRSHHGGPSGPHKSEQEKIQIVKAYLAGGHTLDQVAEEFGVGKKSISRWITIFAGRKSVSRDTEARVTEASAAVAAEAKPNVSLTSQKIYMAKKNTQPEEPDIAALKAEIARLQKEVELANYKVHVRDVMIEEAEKTFSIPIRKKSGTKQ